MTVDQRALSADGLRALSDLATPMAIRVAATLHLADQLAKGRQGSVELADTVGVDAGVLDRLLQHLRQVGVVQQDETQHFYLTPAGEALRSDHPSSLRSSLDLEGPLGRADLSLIYLLHSVRTGKAAFPLLYGTGFWEDLAAQPRLAASFHQQMASYSSLAADALVSAHDWGTLTHLTDVGGGNGRLLSAILTTYPHLRGTVVDQPAAVEEAMARFTEEGLANRASAVVGDFFDEVPTGADGYLLSTILHDWDDASAQKILRRCAQAAGPTGSIFVAEWAGPDAASRITDMDLRMLAYYGGRERGVPELTELAESSGLRVMSTHPAGALVVMRLAH
ncbi:methyltransferase [Streptomyces europaeiscabiei]|uniref:methyltransferase n=1 Tax=Streptomyces europaeiscabiei TaxID=146819 RepID=UPI002E18E835